MNNSTLKQKLLEPIEWLEYLHRTKAVSSFAGGIDKPFVLSCVLSDWVKLLRLAAKRIPEDGWVSVPEEEPTIEMENAGDKADHDYSNNRFAFAGLGHLGRVAFIYHHMIAARPETKKE